MAEVKETKTKRVRRVHHTGRGSQVGIYLGKQFRFFINDKGMYCKRFGRTTRKHDKKCIQSI